MIQDFAKINGKDIYYEYYPGSDDNAGPMLVFLHEGLGNIGQWKKLPELYGEHLKVPVLVYDRLGYGKSSPVQQRDEFYLHDEARIYLPGLLDHLNYNGNINVFGHSDGATLALIFAALNPDRCCKLIAEAPHVIIEDVTANGVLMAIDAYKNGNLKSRMEKYHGSKTAAMFWSWANFWSNPDNGHWNILQLMEGINCPVLYIQGDKDHFGSFEQGMEIRRCIKGQYTELLLENCGHIPHFEAKQEVLDAAIDFFTSD